MLLIYNSYDILIDFVGIITVFSVALLSPKQEDSVTASARSPFSTSPMAPSRAMFQNGIGAEGSPIVGRPETKNQLFVVNPSSTPTQRDTRGFTKIAEGARDSEMAQDASGYQASRSVFPTIFAASSLASGQAAPAAISATRQVPDASMPTPIFTKRPKVSIRGLTISKPMVNDETDPETPFARIATIDLKTAALNDRERRAMTSKKSPFNAPRAVPLRPTMSPEDIKNKSANFARKVAPDQSKEWMAVSGLSTSTSLSPGRDEVRRRSPRGNNNLATLAEKQTFRPAIGLPSNPRTQRSMIPQQNAIPQPQTVMLMNDIIYDNPAIVQSIISKTPGFTKPAFLSELSPLTPYTSGFKFRESVIHRARPIPRYKNSSMFASDPEPGHRRTKSSSAVLNRKSFFTIPGSPSQLPPLPKPPPVYTASKLKRLLPNDTKSMTVNEKIEFLFPAPPGINLLKNRRSSVPYLPSMASNLTTSIEPDLQSKHNSKRTTIALLSPQEHSVKQTSTEANSNRETYRSNGAESVSETLVPSHNSADTNILKLGSESPSSSSHNTGVRELPHSEDYKDQISPSNASDAYRGSSYSAFSPLGNQRFTADIGRLERPSGTPIEDYESGDELMVVMMDPAEHRRSMAESAASDRESFIFDMQGLRVEATHSPPTWHRRIGDELPAFSDRRSKHGARKISPPQALLLEPPRGRASPILIRNPEPSPPLDSPGRALQEIRDQLNRLDEPKRGSLGSILRRMPDNEHLGGLANDDGMERLRLLENLEKEMGEQENDWQHMHQNLSRDSVSSIGTLATPQLQSPPTLPRTVMETGPSNRLSLGLRRSGSSRVTHNRIRDNLAGISMGGGIMSSQVQENHSVGAWQQRLANAQVSYMENVSEASLTRKSSINFLSVSKAPQASMGSPTPPESEHESEEDIIEDEESMFSLPRRSLLWQPLVQSPKAAGSLLWSSANDEHFLESSQSPEPPARNLRPSQRRSENEMLLGSADLWSKSSPSIQSNMAFVKGLWGSTSIRASIVKIRPVTQRPPRKSKRVTLLADIGM